MLGVRNVLPLLLTLSWVLNRNMAVLGARARVGGDTSGDGMVDVAVSSEGDRPKKKLYWKNERGERYSSGIEEDIERDLE